MCPACQLAGWADQNIERNEMGNFKCCPECGSEQITDEKHGGSYLIVCRECGYAVGPYALLWKAIEKWNGIERSAVMPEPVPEQDKKARGRSSRLFCFVFRKHLEQSCFGLEV